jgi:hypothetical protein
MSHRLALSAAVAALFLASPGAFGEDADSGAGAARSAVAESGKSEPGRSDTSKSDTSKIVAIIDEARLVKVPPGAVTLVIGNPTIADVTLLKKNNLMILTPKAYGTTNFIALDGNGNPLAESTIQVVAGESSLIVQRGSERQSYSCAPRCQPEERLGDDDKFMNAVATQAQAHMQRLSGSVAPVGPGTTH